MLPWCSGLALQAALSSVPLWSPFVGFFVDRVPDDLERQEEVCMSATLITGSGQPGLLLGGSVRRLSVDPPATLSLIQGILLAFL